MKKISKPFYRPSFSIKFNFSPTILIYYVWQMKLQPTGGAMQLNLSAEFVSRTLMIQN